MRQCNPVCVHKLTDVVTGLLFCICKLDRVNGMLYVFGSKEIKQVSKSKSKDLSITGNCGYLLVS